MHKIITAVAFSITTLMATSAIASPNTQHGQQQRQDHHNQSSAHYTKPVASHHAQWRSGQSFPSQYHSSRYRVDYRQYKQLPQPGRNQQWYKVNGDYVLVNTQNHKILRVIG
ncbi:nickel/cobalt transporter regulator [Acinetobacter calcoaceticus]|uniref:Nickel/cobalt transporter regulator n=1 Tax=Acinetobacter calcoaceticus TaxID=471 RepID=A0A4R1XLS4_ACICA|nr:nickel/cobalt transporter regulator [Acinetobacter calcoaceticus]